MAPLLQRQAAQTGNTSSFKQAMMPSLPAGARPILRRCTGSGASSSNGARRGQIQVSCSLVKRAEDVHAVKKLPKPVPRSTLRMGLPSKGRMAEDTIQLLKDSALSVYKPNPRQYVASIPQWP
ncbi:hypothetical protein MNEG_3437 [Monoraphidium neglectum]|uniref:Uncharacterized protein n=1 Tax=Monoraphidium neglectum TaxID=145388 RepID=A0A0D2K1R7_9CHLO|nr:hypothetical protein MNEG_3437 [Monoraphidium neglectum]KIZ04528.1 hypothetical protein MNEG_3437 [Monoraphidium neglectum]|eukprot:XP_013903547.1 hypothetical protein MNEG_3437 [Monoraphidium neglectum]